MRILYYAVGLYFVALAQDFLREHNQLHKNIKSWYGGDLAFDAKTKELLLQYRHVW